LCRVGVSVQQFVCQRSKSRGRRRAGSVIAAGSCVWRSANRLWHGVSANCGRAEAQTDQGSTGADRAVKFYRG
jgi:hypothetical protein